jgi:hypothetical protein
MPESVLTASLSNLGSILLGVSSIITAVGTLWLQRRTQHVVKKLESSVNGLQAGAENTARQEGHAAGKREEAEAQERRTGSN